MFSPPIAESSYFVALWAALAVLFTASLVVIRTQWARQRPLHRCVLLSLLAHLVLIAVAATIRLVSWAPGAATDEPLRVTIVAAAPQEVRHTPDTPPATTDGQDESAEPDESLTSEESQSVGDTESPAASDAPLEAPELMPSVAASQSPGDQPAESRASDFDPSPPNPSPDAMEVAAAAPTSRSPISPEVPSPAAATREAPVDPPPQSDIKPALPASLADRTRPDRLQQVIEQGGGQETEQAVARALQWLASAQSADGRWDCARWQGGREFVVLGHNRRGAGSQADTGITGLALLAMLGAGHTHLEGAYRVEVARGLAFLIRTQRADGSLAGESTFYARTYCHSMATFALAEAYALTGDQRLHPATERAVEYLLQAENRSYGGWRYQPGDLGDVSQLGWVIMALRSAELAGIEVPETTWDRIEQFLGRVARGRHGGLAAYQPRTPASRVMTAEAFYCRQVLGKPIPDDALQEAVADLARELPGMGMTNYYYWYYGTLALHNARRQGGSASDAWDRWNERLKRELVASQVADGANAGSWSPNTVWGGYGGRVYSTAMAAMCLEVYYRFRSSPAESSPWVASRPRGDVK